MDEFIGHGIESFSTFRNDTEISTSVKITNAPPEPAATVDPVPPTPVEQEPAVDPAADEKLNQDIKDDSTDLDSNIDAVESLYNMAQNHIILQKHIKKSGKLESDMYAFVDVTMQFRTQAGNFGFNTPSLEAFSPNSAMHRRAVMDASMGTFENIKKRIIIFLKNFIEALKNIGARLVAKIIKSDAYVNQMIKMIESSGLKSVNYSVLGEDGNRQVPKSQALKEVMTEMKTMASTTTFNALTAALKDSNGQADSILSNISKVKQQIENFRGGEGASSEYMTTIDADPQYASANVIIEFLKEAAEILKSHDALEQFLKSVEALIVESINDATKSGDDEASLKIAKYRATMIKTAVQGLMQGYLFIAGTVSQIAGTYMKAVAATKKSSTADNMNTQEATATAV